ncbi:putative glycosyltransferase YkoT [Xanthomonas sacchari]|nr:putative glycosyltransferase YkoT [Xanthomonas sacchari]MCW0386587.1 putative glycosyltransferase YkoT [Xanthomonas sacchari]
MSLPNIAIVIPCYNEQEVLPVTVPKMISIIEDLRARGRIGEDSSVTFVDDGSRDRTWSLIEDAATRHACVHGIKLSRNRGHQNALMAGLLTVEGDAVISVDADLQDDLAAIEKMIEKFSAGTEIVYGVRSRRATDTFFKRLSAEGYYRVLALVGVDVVFNHADYRLMGRSAIEALRQYNEVNLFLRGIIPQLGFSTDVVYYERSERVAGESKYPLGKMLSLAWNGLTSFSSLPLRWITLLGVVISLVSFGFGLWALCVGLFSSRVLPGWASTVIPMYFIGGIQLLSLGVIGEYVSKIYTESKRRPRFVIERKL